MLGEEDHRCGFECIPSDKGNPRQSPYRAAAHTYRLYAGYDDTLFSDESRSAVESRIFMKSVRGVEVPYIKCAIRNKEIKLTDLSKSLALPFKDIQEACAYWEDLRSNNKKKYWIYYKQFTRN